MKKLLLISAVLVFALFVLTACFTKQALTAEEFKVQMEDMGYVVMENSTQYDSSIVRKLYIAKDSSNSFQIEFFEQNTEQDAIASFESNVRAMEAAKSGVSSSYSSNGQNYRKQTMTSNGEYWVVSGIDNTFLFVHTSTENKAAVDEALNKLGY